MFEESLKLLDKITQKYTTGDFYREVYDAKKDYFEMFGIVNEDSSDFENQMNVFMGWYLFDRNLTKFDLPPVQLYFRQEKEDLEPQEQTICENYTKVHHSLFELVKQKEDLLVLKDIVNKTKFSVQDERYAHGFTKGDIFDARLLPLEKDYCFVEGFCFHPRETLKFIQTQIKKIRYQDESQRTKLLLKLRGMKLKHQRFPHIDVKHIYTLEPKF